jgi:hypothetical protein
MAARRKVVGELVDRRASRTEPRVLVDVPERSRRMPTPPRGLSAESRETWRSFWSSDVAHAVDRASDMAGIRRWIRTVDEYEQVSAAIRQTPFVTGSMGQQRLNPLASTLRASPACSWRSRTTTG